MALADQPSAKAIEAALGRPIARDVELIVRRGFATAGNDRLELAHPLFGAAVEALASADERRQVHAQLATAASDEARARHLALATDGPSAEVAAEVEAAAARAVTRAGPAAAAALLELSIERTPSAEADAAARRRVALARYLQRAGDATSAQAVLETVLASGPGPRVRAQARLALAALRYELDPPATITRLAQAALDDAAGDPELTAYGHALVAAASWEDFRARDAHADEAVQWLTRATNPDPMVEALVLMQRCETDAASGRPLDRALVARGLRLERRAATGPVSERFSAALGVWLKYRDEFGGARRWLERTLRAAEDEGDDGSLPYALSHLPQLELWTGRWPEAEAYARRHLEVAMELGLEAQRRQALYNLALVHTHQGREAEARAEIRDGLEAAAQDGDVWTEASLLPLLGLLELSLDRPAAAVAPLLRATELRDQIGQDAPRRHDADLVESLVATGDLETASAAAAAGEDRARRYGTHTAIANALRARALIAGATGDLDGAVASLEDALCEHALAPIPFDRARTLVSLGLVRRRRRERTAARDALAEALAIYASLGAARLVERTRAELDRVGLRRSAGTDLTETERRVAELAARGLTNREVAAAMFVSPKTVEANLARAYHKLGVASRAELGALLGSAIADGAGPRSSRSVHS